MNRQRYLVLHKSEWDRLKRRSSSKNKESNTNDYLKSLIEQSQKWIKTWPDTVQGHVYQLEKQKEIEHAQLIKKVKIFNSRTKQEIKTESIKKAREMIFEDSCYGRQLLSALVASKTLEERDKQVLFQREIKEKLSLQNQKASKASFLQNASDMESNEINMKFLKKQRDLDVARINQAIAKKQRDDKTKQKEKDKSEVLKDDFLERELLEQEIKIKINKVNLEKQLINEFEADRKQIEKLQKQREDEDERLREVYKKYHELIKNKKRKIFNEIHKNKTNTLQVQHIYNIIKNINDEKIKQYNEFIDKGVKHLINSEKTKEKAEIKMKIMERNKRKLLDAENETLAELQHQLKSQYNTKHVCCRQCIIRNSCDKSKNAGQPQLSTEKILLDDLKNRKKESSPWSGLNTAHVQFAQHASETLKECHYKRMARKVIDDYRKINCLDAKSLPIPDY